MVESQNFTPISPPHRHCPLKKTEIIGRYTNRRPRKGPRPSFQWARQEPQRPARSVRFLEIAVMGEILEEGGAENEVMRKGVG